MHASIGRRFMKNAVDHGTCDRIADGGGDSEAQVPVSSLICPRARFFCPRTQVCVRAMLWLSGCCFCGILLGLSRYHPGLCSCHGLKGFVSLLSETKQILITTEGADTPCVSTSETRPINLKLVPAPCANSSIDDCAPGRKEIAFPLTVMSAHHLETPPHLPFQLEVGHSSLWPASICFPGFPLRRISV